MAVRVRIEADRAAWNRQIDLRFRFFQNKTEASSKIVAFRLEREVDELVRSRLTRTENPQRQRRRGLADAIKESIMPVKGGRGGYGVGVRVTDPQTLSRIAAYWHAIEVGSSHIIGVKVIGFGVRRRGKMTVSKLTPPGLATREPDAFALTGASYGKLAVVRKPITAHRYLETVSERAVRRFSARVAMDLERSFSG